MSTTVVLTAFVNAVPASHDRGNVLDTLPCLLGGIAAAELAGRWNDAWKISLVRLAAAHRSATLVVRGAEASSTAASGLGRSSCYPVALLPTLPYASVERMYSAATHLRPFLVPIPCTLRPPGPMPKRPACHRARRFGTAPRQPRIEPDGRMVSCGLSAVRATWRKPANAKMNKKRALNNAHIDPAA
ncbi:hypothetical protein KTF37_05360 [Burkholderia multivorans]|uniref:hypothetical protein n=1 Tax=Burkholderia multivorans TaxID=87883 RepID=UPI001C23D278|nr:hypothetical protein [Burkholderia multivorans]MBU9676270.1 hypothetical protein [Burkholderia multivorans]